MPILRKACCCWPLYVGTSVIGWLGILCGLLECFLYSHIYLNEYLTTRTFLLCIVSSIIHVMFSVYVVKAVLTNNRFYLVPWLVTTAILLIFCHTWIGYLIENTLVMIQYCMVLLILDFISGYLWLWVYAYYQQIKDDEKLFRTSVNRHLQQV